jgi:hypothetical protein
MMGHCFQHAREKAILAAWIAIQLSFLLPTLGAQSLSKAHKFGTKCRNGDQKACSELIRLATTDKKPDERSAAVQNLSDAAVLSRIAGNDPDYQVRMIAVARLTDQIMLIDIAKTAADADVRMAAIEKISESKALAEPAIQSFLAERLINLQNQNERSRVLRYLTDREVLEGEVVQRAIAGIAKNHSDQSVRASAFEKLSSQAILAEIAMKDKDSNIRSIAAKKLTDQAVLAEIAMNDTSSVVWDAAVINLNDEALLVEVIKKRILWTALRKLRNQQLLAEVAKFCKNMQVSDFVAKQLTDENVLTEIAKTSQDTILVNRAADQLMDQSVLGYIAKTHSLHSIQDRIYKKITDQNVLVDIVKTAKDPNVRLRAATSITDDKILSDIAKDGQDPQVRLAAVKKISDQKLLADIAKMGKETSVRYSAILRLTDQAVLSEIAKKETDSDLCKAAIENLNDQTALAAIAKSGKASRVRQSAVHKLSDQKLLAEFTKTEPDIDLVITAVERLTVLSAQNISAGYNEDKQDLKRLRPGDSIQVKCGTFSKSDVLTDFRAKAIAELSGILKNMGFNPIPGENSGGAVVELVVGLTPGFMKLGVFENGEIKKPEIMLVMGNCTGAMSVRIAQDVLSVIPFQFTTDLGTPATAATSFSKAPLEDALAGGLGELLKKLTGILKPDKEKVAQIARSANYAAVRKGAFGYLSEQTVLADIAKTDKDAGVRKEAVGKISDTSLLADAGVQAALVEVARRTGKWSERMGAVRKLTDPQVLADIAKTDEDMTVRQVAESRLKQLQGK